MSIASRRFIAATLLIATFVAGMARADEIDAPQPASEITVRATAAPPRGRLGDLVRPRQYRLDLTVDPSRPRFGGRVEIDAYLASPSAVIDLHGRGLTVSRVTAKSGGKTVEGKWTQIDPGGVARVEFAQSLPAGEVTLAFDYDAPFADSPAGMFRVEVEGQWYSWTQFQSIDARAAFPCFDEPGFKTPFTVTLRTPQGLMAVSNAPEAGVTFENGQSVHRFEQTAPMPTYLLAMMVGPFVQQAGATEPNRWRAEPLPVRIVSTRPNAGKLDFALENTHRIVALMEDYFGGHFPYPKLDQITTPILPGAMENPGADLYRDDLLVLDAQSPVRQQRDFGRIVAHELGHQWFGDLVTPEWWDDIWLNESFANWLSSRIGDAWRPDLGISGDVLGEGYLAMETDALLAGRPIRQTITDSSRIDAAFDSITYGKGGHVVGMIAAWLGDDTFREGVRRYIAAHRDASATSNDFFAALAEVAGDPRLVPALRSFVEQQGVPMLAIRRDKDRVIATQLRYTTAGVAPTPERWTIPLCLRRGTNRQCFIMDQRTQSFTVPGEGPVFPNAGGAGYFRFELTASHWRDLISVADTLPGGEALALVDSLSASIRAGRGTVTEMARLARKLIRHPDPHAADAADKALSRLQRDGLVGPNGRRSYRAFRESLYAPFLAEYGFDPARGVYAHETPARTQRRVQIISALLGTSRGRELRQKMEAGVVAYLAGNHDALDPAWFDHALDVYLDDRDESAARTLVQTALGSEDPVFRPAVLGAAARTSRISMAKWLMGLTDPRLRENEKWDFLDNIMARSATREFGYEWALAHLETVLAGSDGQFFSRRLPQVLGRFCSVEWAQRIKADFGMRLTDTAGALELDRAVERVRNCGLLDDMIGPQIEEEFVLLR